jgi:hypothetical protein
MGWQVKHTNALIHVAIIIVVGVSLCAVIGQHNFTFGPPAASDYGKQVIDVYQVETTRPWPVKNADGTFEKTYGSFWATVDAGHVGAERQHIAYSVS